MPDAEEVELHDHNRLEEAIDELFAIPTDDESTEDKDEEEDKEE